MNKTIQIPESVIEWLKTGRRGLSSETIISHLYQIPINQRQSHPYDTADVGRCIALLDACPEVRERFAEMQTRSTTWDAFVTHWPEIETQYHRENYQAVYDLCLLCRDVARS